MYAQRKCEALNDLSVGDKVLAREVCEAILRENANAIGTADAILIVYPSATRIITPDDSSLVFNVVSELTGANRSGNTLFARED